MIPVINGQYSLVNDPRKGNLFHCSHEESHLKLWLHTNAEPNLPLFFTLRGKESMAMRLAGSNLLKKFTANPSNWSSKCDSATQPSHINVPYTDNVPWKAGLEQCLFPSHGSWPEMFLAKGTDVSGISADPLPFETCSTNQTSNEPTKKHLEEDGVPGLWGRIFWMALEKTLKNATRKEYLLKSISWPHLHPNLYIKAWFKGNFLAGTHQLPHSFHHSRWYLLSSCFFWAFSLPSFSCVSTSLGKSQEKSTTLVSFRDYIQKPTAKEEYTVITQYSSIQKSPQFCVWVRKSWRSVIFTALSLSGKALTRTSNMNWSTNFPFQWDVSRSQYP